MKFSINLTWSKVMALVIFLGALYLDIINGGTTMSMYALPFLSALILGKQGQQLIEKLKQK